MSSEGFGSEWVCQAEGVAVSGCVRQRVWQ